MSTRLRILLEINGNRYRGGEVRRALTSYLEDVGLPHRYWPKLSSLQGLQEAMKMLPKCNMRLFAVREPRGTRRVKSVYWQEFWKKRQKKTRSYSMRDILAIPVAEPNQIDRAVVARQIRESRAAVAQANATIRQTSVG